MANSTYKDVKPMDDGVIERVIIDRITIKPMSTRNLLELLNAAEKEEKVKLRKITFESSPQSSRMSKVGFGKSKKLELRITETGVCVPQKTMILSEKYTTEDLIGAFNELEQWLIDNKHDYSLDIYPKAIELIDKGAPPTFAPMILKFEKRRKVDKQSEVGVMLNNQKMPVDAVMLFTTEINRRTGNYNKKSIPSRIAEQIKFYEKGAYILNADDIKTYTRNIYNAEFTIRTSCEVGKQRKVFDKYTPLTDGTCKIIPK